MKAIRVILVVTMCLGGVAMFTASTEAQVTETLYFCTDDGTWSNAANWFLSYDGSTCSNPAGHIPQHEDDHVIIVANITCIINAAGAACGDLTVQSGAKLNLDPGDGLEITGDGGVFESTITGTIYLQGDSSRLNFTEDNHTVLGAGKIVGQHHKR